MSDCVLPLSRDLLSSEYKTNETNSPIGSTALTIRRIAVFRNGRIGLLLFELYRSTTKQIVVTGRDYMCPSVTLRPDYLGRTIACLEERFTSRSAERFYIDFCVRRNGTSASACISFLSHAFETPLFSPRAGRS